jgi:hypothetical protein
LNKPFYSWWSTKENYLLQKANRKHKYMWLCWAHYPTNNLLHVIYKPKEGLAELNSAYEDMIKDYASQYQFLEIDFSVQKKQYLIFWSSWNEQWKTYQKDEADTLEEVKEKLTTLHQSVQGHGTNAECLVVNLSKMCFEFDFRKYTVPCFKTVVFVDTAYAPHLPSLHELLSFEL